MLKVVVTGYLKKTYRDYCMPGSIASTRRYVEEISSNKTRHSLSRLSRGRFSLHRVGLAMRWTMNLLSHARPSLRGEAREFDRPSRPGRFINSANDSDVGESFQPRRFRLSVAQSTVGEMDQLRGKLAALGKAFGLRFVADRNLMLESHRIIHARTKPPE